MSPAQPTQKQNTGSDADAADNKTQPSRLRVLGWALPGLLVIGGPITLVWWLLIGLSLTLLLLWLPAVLLVGVLVAAVWRWS